MADDAGPPTDEVLRYVDEAAARASGAAAGGWALDGSSTATIEEVRRHLDQARAMASAGTDLPADVRMRQVKRAVLMAMRPVTSHQVPFNRELADAVRTLADGLGGLEARIDENDRAVDTASAQLHAALATSELTVDDVADALNHLTETVGQLLVRTERLERELGADRSAIRALRGRQDLVLRAARAAIAEPSDPGHLAELASDGDHRAEDLAEELADLTCGTRDEVRTDVDPFVADVVALGPNAPVVDLGCGRGEWLEALRDHGSEAYGVDPSPRLIAAGLERGLDVRREDAVAHLTALPESSMAAVTAFHLVDRVSTEALVDLVDGSLRALRPGGLLIMSAANPTALDVGAADFWLDPARRRPVHPRLLELLVLSRGFAEVELRWMRPADTARSLRPDDFVALGQARAAAVVEQLNAALAGPRRYAVVARKPGGG